MIRKVLLVDDDKDWLEGAAQFFRSEGYAVLTASTFHEGQSAIETFAPDLLITDVRLRESNGLHLIVRSRDRHPHMAAIVVSAHDDPVLVRDATLHGAFAYLVKPIDPLVLLDRAAAALATRSRRRSARRIAPDGLRAEVQGQAARLLDVSYEGMRLELPFPAPAGFPLEIRVAALDRPMSARTVWVRENSTSGLQQCGAVLIMDDQTAGAWRRLVDGADATP